jgi:hypothetical protein
MINRCRRSAGTTREARPRGRDPGSRAGNQDGQLAVATSFDGLHSLFAAGSPVVGQPAAGLVGADGSLVGQALTVTTTADDMLWDDLLLTPTAHGGTVSMRDKLDGVPRWRIVELDATGSLRGVGGIRAGRWGPWRRFISTWKWAAAPEAFNSRWPT